MKSFHRFLGSPAGRALALLLCGCVGLVACPPGGGKPLGPAAGLPEYQEIAAIEVPGGRVNVAGGNLQVRRVDLSIDTQLGTREIGATFDATAGKWFWSFDLRYDGSTFRDPTGAVHPLGSVSPGQAIPGTVWVVVDGDTVKTKGGLAHDFDAEGNLAAIHWTSSPYPRLASTSSLVAGQWRPTRVSQCTAAASCTDVFDLSYDGTGRLVSIVDRAGRRAEFSWNASDRLQSARDGLDIARGWPGFRYEYHGSRISSITNSEAERTEYSYDGSGRLREVRQIGGGNPVHRFSYHKKIDGLYWTRFWAPTGHETRYRYDTSRRLREVEQVGTGELTVLLWSGVRPLAEIVPSGATTLWSWVGDDVATRTEPWGNEVSYSWAPDAVNRDAPFGRPLLTATDTLGPLESRSYDSAGRLTAITNGAGETTRYTYGENELVETIAGPNGVVRTCLEHGEHGHPLRIRLGEIEELRVFDAVGNLLRGTREFEPLPGGVLSRTWDEDRNLAGLELADLDSSGVATRSEWVTLERRSDGRLLRIQRPGGADHEIDYDALGRAVERRERVDGVWRATQFEYDPSGRIAASELPNGMRQELAYDPAGRITTHRALRAGSLEANVDFAYSSGRLASVDDSQRGGTEDLFYDSAGRLVQIDFPDGERLVLGHDARGRRISEDYWLPSAVLLRSLSFQFDAADREVGVSDGGLPLIAHSYQNGQLAATASGNGLVRSYAYDPLTGLLDGSTTVDGSGAPVEDTTVLREAVSGIFSYLEITAETTTHAGVVATTSEHYALAPLLNDPTPWIDAGRRVWFWTADTGEARYFTYDSLGNQTGLIPPSSFVYNAEGNRLLQANPDGQGAIDYSYDEAGFATSRAGVPLSWTASGRLSAYGADTTLEWDGLDRLISTSFDGQTLRWRFGGRVLADADGSPVALERDELRIDLVGGTRTYRHFDFRGNVKFVTDDAGAVVSHTRYGPYGVDEVLGADDDPIRFVGRAELGDLAILGARIYDPAVGRFLSPDPILGLVNQYAYTLGNPVWFTDPDGLESTLAGEIEDGASGVAFAAGVVAAVASGPVGAVALAIALGIGGLAFAMLVARRLSRVAGAANGTASFGCSPASLVSVPRPGWLLYAVILLQLLLSLLVLRQRRGDSR